MQDRARKKAKNRKNISLDIYRILCYNTSVLRYRNEKNKVCLRAGLFYDDRVVSNMKLILGLDAGSSSTKLMAMTEDGAKFIVPMRMGPMTDHKSFCAALSRFAADNSMTVEDDFAYVAVTGGRATHVGEEILGVPVRRINEINAMSTGALRFSSRKKGVVVNMGTGTAMVYAEEGKEPQHIFGSAVGGGTLMGLGSRLIGSANYTEIVHLASKGDRTHADVSIADMDFEDVDTLDPRMTLSNFGKLRPEDGVEAKDTAAALVNLILEVVGTEAMLACRSVNCDTAIVAGTLADLPGSRETFDLFEKLCGIKFVKAGMPSFVTAAGALLCAMEG